MRQDLTVAKSVDIDAPPAEVWQALTDPAMIKEYLFGTECITDWKVGSKIIFQGEYDGKKYVDKGVVVQNEKPKLLSYEYWSAFTGLADKKENYSLITYTLAPKSEDETTLTWTQRGFVNQEAQQNSESGMDAFLLTIKEVAEG